MVNRAVALETVVVKRRDHDDYMVLHCRHIQNYFKLLSMPVLEKSGGRFARLVRMDSREKEKVWLSISDAAQHLVQQNILVNCERDYEAFIRTPGREYKQFYGFVIRHLPEGLHVSAVHPAGRWMNETYFTTDEGFNRDPITAILSFSPVKSEFSEHSNLALHMRVGELPFRACGLSWHKESGQANTVEMLEQTWAQEVISGPYEFKVQVELEMVSGIPMFVVDILSTLRT
jgi:hypothetical protein